MADWGSAQHGAGESLSDGVDAAHDGVRTFPWVGLVQDAGGRDTVEIFTSDGDTNDQVHQFLSILGDGRAKGGQLIVEYFVSGAEEDAEQELGLGGIGSCNGFGGGVWSASLQEQLAH